MKTTGETIDALGAYIGQQAIGRGIQEYRILLYQRPTGDCLKEDEFFDVGRGEKREGKRTLSIGNDAVAHTQTHFVRGLAQGDEAKFKRLWRKLLGAPSD
jgi:hypothetical protein